MDYRKLMPEVYENSCYALVELFTPVPVTGAVSLNAEGIPMMGLSFHLTDKQHLHHLLSVMGFEFDDQFNPTHHELPYVNALRALLHNQRTALKANELQAELNKVMQKRAVNLLVYSLDTNPRQEFMLCDQQEIHKVFDLIAIACEKKINDFVARIPLSEERLALFSMAYFGCDFSDELLKKAIISGNRQEAWSCIRYRSSTCDTTNAAAFNRYRYEAQLFGL